MELAHSARMKPRAEVGGNGGRDERTSLRMPVESLEKLLQRARNAGAALFGEGPRLGEMTDRKNAGDDLRLDPKRRRLVAEPKEAIGGEEELGYRPIRSGVDLAPKVVEVGCPIGRIRMAFRIGRD